MNNLQHGKFCLVILNVLLQFQVLAGKGIITGKVVHQDEPKEFVAIQVVNTTLGTYTNTDGYFEIQDAPVGSYTLKVKALGYRPYVTTVSVSEDQVTELEISLIEDLLNLNEVVVSGTRYELDRDEAPVVVGVVGQGILRATQSMVISEGLLFQPGVRVETNCQNCGFTQVRMNGLEGGYSQILINSRPVFSALNSVYGLEQIPTNIVERIEVVRSGGSALYGSNAIAGTINIITKDPIINSWSIGSNFSLIKSDAKDRTTNFNGSLVNKDLTSGVTLYGMNRTRDAFDANGDGFTELVTLQNNTAGTKAFFRPGKFSKISFDFNAIQENRRGGNRLKLAPHLTDIAEELDHNTLMSGITFDFFTPDQKNKYSIYVSGQRTERQSYYGGLGGGRTAQDSILALNAYGLTNDFSIVSGGQFIRNTASGDALTLGIESNYSHVKDNIEGYERSVDQRVNALGIYGQYEWRPTAEFTTLIGGRLDLTQVDGTYQLGPLSRKSDVSIRVFSPRISLLYRPSPSVQLRGGYARGFRAPQAFNEDLHISSVGGEPQFVILSDNLDKETSDAFTVSLNFSQDQGKMARNLLIEGFYTRLYNPFTFVSTGSTLSNGSILEEVRNGSGAFVSGMNFEGGISPTSDYRFQIGGTIQQSRYRQNQVLFEPEINTEGESKVAIRKFVRNPNLYGYFNFTWKATEKLSLDLTGTYTGIMIVPRVVSESGYLDLVGSNPFFDANFKASYHIDLSDDFHLEISGGLKNMFNSYQNDFDTGAGRDSDFIYGPALPRSVFFAIKIGSDHWSR